MNRKVKILISCLLGVLAIGLIALREVFLGQTLLKLETSADLPVEIDLYEHPGWIGAPWYSFFVIQQDKRTYLGDIDFNDTRAANNLFGSKDRKVIALVSSEGTTVYDISLGRCFAGKGSRPAPEEIIAAHGGLGASLLDDIPITSQGFVWRDLVPREAF